MPGVYAFFTKGIPGIVDVVTILKTVEQLNEIKDQFKNNFNISEMKTAIWTDVKEMNYNLAIIAENRRTTTEPCSTPRKLVQIKNGINQIDEIDQKIADALAENGRISMVELAKAANVSSSISKRRYGKLKENGALKVTIQLDPHKIGYQALCIFFTTISFEKLSSIIQEISKIPDIISIMKTTGDYDLQIYAMIPNLEQMLFIKEEISKIDGIIRMDFEINRISEKMDKWPSPRQYISTF
jgi:DNA-binding Lrp family transcriptional regulator